jgi:hypothetical protein
LTINVLEVSGVFGFALDNWRLKHNATKTLDAFKVHFNKEDSKRESASSPPKLVVIMEPTVPTAIAPMIRIP